MASTVPMKEDLSDAESYDGTVEVPMRTSPYSADVGNVESLKHLSPDAQARKLVEIKKGANIMSTMQPFPDSRSCQDVLWALLFILTVVGTVVLAYVYSAPALKAFKTVHQQVYTDLGTNTTIPLRETVKSVSVVVSPGLAGTLAGLAAANFFLLFARCNAECLVYTALFLAPALLVLQGVVFMVVGKGDASMIALGCIPIFLGVCIMSCVCCCWRRYIPFTAAVVQVVADVADDHPCMIVVSLLGSAVAAGWAILVGVATLGLRKELQQDVASHGTNTSTVAGVLLGLTLLWGVGVISNCCHCTYSGIFGRWYFNKTDGMLCSSLCAATTTSLGSICFGSLLVSIVQLVGSVVRDGRRNAQQDGNIIGCVLLLCVECLLSCIGDILEYFNDWAFVQCAIRGTSYCESARITMALCTCANVRFIFAELLIGSVTFLGAVFCAIVGTLVGMGAGLAHGNEDRVTVATWGALLGCLGGLLAGASAMSIVPSGAKTLLTCWAEDPTQLQDSHPQVHNMFCQRIRDGAYGR